MMHRRWMMMSALVVIAACDSVTTGPGSGGANRRASNNNPKPQQASTSFLRAVAGCDDLAATLKDSAIEEMEQAVESQRAWALQAVAHPEWYCCAQAYATDSDYYCYGGGYGDDDAGASPPMSADAGSAESSESNEAATDYTTTNNQVVGVDEADFVKNDGTYIYLIAGEQFMIIKAYPAASTEVLASYTLEGRPQKLFVHDNRALIYSSVGDSYSCTWTDDGYAVTGQEIKATVLDIAVRTAPALVREIYVSGNFVAARRIGASIHTVISEPQDVGPAYPTWPTDLPYSFCDSGLTEADVNGAFDVLIEANRIAIEATDVSDYLPSARDVRYGSGEPVTSTGLFVDCANFFEPLVADSQGFLSVVSADLTRDDVLQATTIMGAAGEVYASEQALYVATRTSEYVNDGYEENTVIHKFDLVADADGAPGSAYAASGSVSGRLINQFAMDEHEGRLRVATTQWSPQTSNNVFVLEEVMSPIFEPGSECTGEGGVLLDDCMLVTEPSLAVVGAIDNIAPTEDIRSVRFDGDRGFMVTFKKTDPLYAFDLSDPYAPKITGELKIPGFSTYMHFMDDDHLLTIGFDAQDMGSFAWFQGVMLQIFDVSNPADLKLVHKEIIGTRGTTSDATDDHLAFNFFKAKSLLAIPMGICEDAAGGGNYGQQMTFNGLMIYRVTVEGGFEYLGGVDHRDGAETTGTEWGYDSGCYNWWASPNSQVKRSIFMDDFVYSMSASKLKANEMGDLGTDLAVIDLPESDLSAPACGWYE